MKATFQIQRKVGEAPPSLGQGSLTSRFLSPLAPATPAWQVLTGDLAGSPHAETTDRALFVIRGRRAPVRGAGVRDGGVPPADETG